MHPAHKIEPANRDRGAVVTYAAADRAHRHDGVTQAAIAARLAALKGYHFAGEFDPADRPSGRVYFVPGATMVGIAAANALGVRTEDDLFGGVVPHPFVATKAITHPLVEPDAAAPEGWSHGFARRVRSVVLLGFTAFTLQDARQAGLRLLERGPVRLKQPRSAGWRDQVVATAPGELEAALDDLDPSDLSQHGLVLERNLDDVTTYSVGQVRLDGLTVTYCGTQRATPDNAGATVYGGSDLLVVRGDYGALLGLGPGPAFRRAIAQARVYEAATEEFAGFFASRRNYDVARGRDAHGRWRCGVLEPSWRIGGASGPEVAALEAFRADAALTAVRAWCVESYGPNLEPPPRAVVHYHGVDERLGPLIKYTRTSRMSHRDESVAIPVDEEFIDGTLLTPDPPAAAAPGVLFLHGWGGSQEQYLGRARTVASLGCVCLVFDLRGHVRSERRREVVSREDNLRDCLAAYDRLIAAPGVDPSAVGVVGSSYGGYLAAILTSLRAVRWLGLRAPALYEDDGWSLPKRWLHHDTDLLAFRHRAVPPEENVALRASAAFRGDVLLIESERDNVVLHPVIESYLSACVHARSLTYRVLEGADHGLSEESWRSAYTTLLVNWLSEMTAGLRGPR